MALTPPIAFRSRNAMPGVRPPEGDAVGGAGRDRTGDPLVANQVLSQLSYSPSFAMGAAGGSHHHDGDGGRWPQPSLWDGGPLDAATAVALSRARNGGPKWI